MLITNELASSGLGFHWAPGEVVDVPDDAAAVLLAIQDAGFTVAPEVEKPKPARAKSKTITEVEGTHADTTDL